MQSQVNIRPNLSQQKSLINAVSRPLQVRKSIDPVTFLTNASPGTRRVCNILIHYYCQWNKVEPSQAHLGRVTGLTRETVNRIVSNLEDAGIIKTNYRHWRSSVYKVSEVLFSPSVVRQLRSLLPALCLAIGLVSNAFGENVTLYIKKSLRVKELTLRSQPTKVVCARFHARGIPFDHRSVMNAAEDMISPVVQNIPGANLIAKIRLSAFPDVVVTYAIEQMKGNRQQIRDGFRWFFKVCDLRCSATEQKADYGWANQIMVALGNPEGEPMIVRPVETPPSKLTAAYQPQILKGKVALGAKQAATSRRTTQGPTRIQQWRDELERDREINIKKWDELDLSSRFNERCGGYVGNPFRRPTPEEMVAENAEAP